MKRRFKNLLIKIFNRSHLILLLIYSIFYTIPKLLFISFNKKNIKIEFGSGPNIYSHQRNEYLTSDRFFKCDLPWDARIPMPFINKKVSSIYSSHFLEHLSFEELKNHLRYCSNYLLSEGGNYTLSVPNAKLYLDAYSESRDSELLNLAWGPGLPNTGSHMDQIN